MNIIEIIKFLYKKFNDISADSLNKFFDWLFQIPKSLKVTLIVVLTIGSFYYGYQKIYQREISIIQREVDELSEILEYSVNSRDYSNDIYCLLNTICTIETIQKYAYEEENLQLTLIKKFIQKEHPNDPILYDINSMIDRNNYNYYIYSKEFEKYIKMCKSSIVQKENNDSLKIFNDK